MEYLGLNGCMLLNFIVFLFFVMMVSGIYYRNIVDVIMSLASRGLYVYVDKDFDVANGIASLFRMSFLIG